MLRVVPLTLREGNALVAQWHRHHKPARGHRFSIGTLDGSGTLVGAAIVGRPVSRGCNPAEVAEVTRLVTNGARNACSKLYGAAARICKEMGFLTIQTYILDSESAISLRAAGWEFDGYVVGRQWAHTDGKPRRTDQPTCDKQRWIKRLNAR